MTAEELLTIPVVGSLSLFLSYLDEEYIKSLQRISYHSIDYVVRLRDETPLIELLTKVQSYLIRVDAQPEAAELALLTVEHLYYRHDSIAQTIHTKDPTKPAPPSSQDLIQDLCTYVYQHGTDRSKTHAMMCHIYHHALHDRSARRWPRSSVAAALRAGPLHPNPSSQTCVAPIPIRPNTIDGIRSYVAKDPSPTTLTLCLPIVLLLPLNLFPSAIPSSTSSNPSI